MHAAKDRSGRNCTYYDSLEEVKELAFNPPRFCENCGSPLMYWSFYDDLDRFTLKAGCKNCGYNRAIALNKDKYEANMLKHWTKLVKDRAGNRCEMASPECSGELHAHHMIPKHLDPNLKYRVENGICLCETHHKLIHRYM